MKAAAEVLAFSIGASALLAAATSSLPGGSTETSASLVGVWTAAAAPGRTERGDGTGSLLLTMRRGRLGGESTSSETIALSEFRGLAPAQLAATSADSRFEWARDAGTFTLEGQFRSGKGAGHFVFEPSPAYVAELRREGYDLDEEKALTLALHDVSRTFLRDLASLGYPHPSLDELIALRIHGADADFVRALQGLGYDHLTMAELVTFRIHGVSPEYVKALRGLGLLSQSPDELVTFRIHGVSPEYIRAFQDLGYRRLTADQLVAMRIHGVGAEFVQKLKKLGYEAVSVDDLVAMRIHGVTAEFIERMQLREGRAVSLDRAVEARIHGDER